jgi:predicted nucleic acid-binding protein
VNVVDSSAWLEYLADGPNAATFAGPIEATDELVVPAITLYEVFKCACRLRGESVALAAVGAMLAGRVVDLGAGLALDAARLSLEHGLPMADAAILATARSERAVLWTLDAHFAGLEGVEYRASVE